MLSLSRLACGGLAAAACVVSAHSQNTRWLHGDSLRFHGEGRRAAESSIHWVTAGSSHQSTAALAGGAVVSTSLRPKSPLRERYWLVGGQTASGITDTAFFRSHWLREIFASLAARGAPAGVAGSGDMASFRWTHLTWSGAMEGRESWRAEIDLFTQQPDPVGAPLATRYAIRGLFLRPVGSGWQAGLEYLSDGHAFYDLGSFRRYEHILAPLVDGPAGVGFRVRGQVLFGLTTGPAEQHVRLFLHSKW